MYTMIKSIAKSSHRTAKVIETVYPLAKCAKLDTLAFSCAAASIANTPSGYFNPPGYLEGKKSRGKGIEKSFQT